MAAFHLLGISLPAFSLKPAKVLRKLAPLDLLAKANDALMNNEIIFDDHPIFSRAYQLNGADEVALHRLFKDELLEFWEKLPAKEKWAVDASDNWVIVYRDNTLVPPAGLRAFLHGAEEISAMFFRDANVYQTIK